MKEYRQNSHTWSLIFWALLCTATAIVLFIHSSKVVSRTLKVEEMLGGVALLIFGPAALTAYLIRARRIWVGVDPDRGILLSGRRVIPWTEIAGVERRRPLFRKSTGPLRVPDAPDAVTLGTGCGDLGCLPALGEIFLGILILIAAVYLLWVIFFVLIPLLILPLLEVFAPFGDRIKIKMRRGTLVLRDLSDADEFLRAVAQRRPVTER